MAERETSLSGLTEAEAKEFHAIFVSSFIGFIVVALVAHVLAWNFRPWLQKAPAGWALLETLTSLV
ncbi:Light-harvesting LHI, beta subunit [Rhodovulum sp. PH10]|uniref:light-harvesting antenna LH1, beta subunit n=1 Tax=Rhodovulum sp. PH10 TaxID=1187851 RepID=UPI00027C219B|nr:light-harvesting antenna LH1, beta subunit [Rhodovulum sp. PH10]EJW12810.1 Light-harvesting LHI, beta subunit [Rhodovulum sp. PH10]